MGVSKFFAGSRAGKNLQIKGFARASFVMDILPSTFWEGVVAVLVLVVAVASLKIVFSFQFNLNRWMDARRKGLKEKIKNTCPHTKLSVGEGGIYVESLFYKPPFSLVYRCSQCGLQTCDPNVIQATVEQYGHNPQLYPLQLKKLRRLKKKL